MSVRKAVITEQRLLVKSNPSLYRLGYDLSVRLDVPAHGNEGSSSHGSGASFPAGGGGTWVKCPADSIFLCRACVLMALSFRRFSIFLALMDFFFSFSFSFSFLLWSPCSCAAPSSAC